MQRIIGIGQMSGTSLDGLDLAACAFTQEAGSWRFEILAAQTVPYSPEWAERLQALPHQSAEDYAKTHVDYGHFLGMALRRFGIENGIKPAFGALHGHTVFHQPQRHFTAQLGCGETAVTHVPYPLVSNFRARDVALGGEGAPLVPFAEQALFPETTLFLNLGGIANISYLPSLGATQTAAEGAVWRRGLWQHIAYDVCPCNLVLNAIAKRCGLDYDDAGTLAKGGKLLPELLQLLEAIPFYQLPAPRTLGREWVDSEAMPLLTAEHQPQDLLHTLTQHIASRITAEVKRLGAVGSMLVTGGGAYNTYLLESLQAVLAPIGVQPIVPHASLVEYKEALAFAFLGLQTLRGLPNVLATATGAREAMPSGAIHVPKGYALFRED